MGDRATPETCEVCGREKMPPCPHQSVEGGSMRCLACGKSLIGNPPVFEQAPAPANPCKRGHYADGAIYAAECYSLGYARERTARQAAETRVAELEAERSGLYADAIAAADYSGGVMVAYEEQKAKLRTAEEALELALVEIDEWLEEIRGDEDAYSLGGTHERRARIDAALAALRWQVAPAAGAGAPPADWRCPNCGMDRDGRERLPPAQPPATPPLFADRGDYHGEE